MGAYGENLSKRLRDREAKPGRDAERLVSVAIIRNGETHSRGFRSHYELRQALDPKNRNLSNESVPGDIEGFLTSSDRFVNREEAKAVAIAAGQIHSRWQGSPRKLLSSDIDW